MTTFTKTNEQLAARRARVKEMEMQGRVFNSSMRARAIREAKRVEKIQDLADNIIVGLQSNPNIKREVVKVQEINYIDTTGFSIVNLESADKDAYRNSRRSEYIKNNKLERMADAILKDLQSEDETDDNIDDEKMDANSIRNEDETDNNNDEDNEDNEDYIDEDEMNSILNVVRNDNADNYMDENGEDNYIEEEVIVENNNSDESEDEGYYEFNKIQQRIVNHLTKKGYYELKDVEFHKYFNDIQSLVDRNIIEMGNDGILYPV